MDEEEYRLRMLLSAEKTKTREKRARLASSVFAMIREAPDHDEKKLMQEFAVLAGCDVKSLIGNTKVKPIVDARHILAHTMHHRLGIAMSKIAHLLAKDESSIRYAIKRADVILQKNTFLAEHIDAAVEASRRK